MLRTLPWRRAALPLLCAFSGLTPTADPTASEELFAATFDAHWQRLKDEYPFFELYGVDWDAERAEHRPRALAAANADEFAWELARLIASLPDPHVAFIPSLAVIDGRWSYPDIDTTMIARRPHVSGWPADLEVDLPPKYAHDERAYPELISIQGEAPGGAADILAAGPLGSTVVIGLRWPDGSETEHSLKRPDVSNLPPPDKHFGAQWLVSGRIGAIGYVRIKTFDPKLATLGPDGKMTTMLRAVLAELDDTSGLILDLQRNGGGLVAASDPFLGNLIEKSVGYLWGNSGGKRRVIRPRRPRYEGKVVALVDERSASGGEWAARILRDAGRAKVVGGRTAGAEAAVHRSEGPDGSVVHYSAWPMVEPGRAPFQERGIEVDHLIELTLADARKLGIEAARKRVQRARFAQALEILGAPASDVDAFCALAARANGEAP